MKALVIIDVQKGMFASATPYDGDEVVARLAMVLNNARQAQVPVIFVQHDGGKGSPLDPDGAGFVYHDALTPLPTETVVVKKHCSAFQDTEFHATLIAAGIDHIITGGMQSEYCVDTAVRGAFERGLKVTLIADGHTTFDTPALPAEQVIAHHNHTLGTGGFATLRESDDISLFEPPRK
jgi:nicotinamidase-related amidase